jgi:hypothetical protein
MPTPLRRFRCPDEVYDPAIAKAQAEGTTLTEVIVSHLRDYVAGGEDHGTEGRWITDGG